MPPDVIFHHKVTVTNNPTETSIWNSVVWMETSKHLFSSVTSCYNRSPHHNFALPSSMFGSFHNPPPPLCSALPPSYSLCKSWLERTYFSMGIDRFEHTDQTEIQPYCMFPCFQDCFQGQRRENKLKKESDFCRAAASPTVNLQSVLWERTRVAS